ncbi:uncharacterized protein EDB91DRAFT_1078297 [Suillus paluster]|uniref:uncharacterized protein n=1 Tax=Suillus paluster TaxID=48578 RepID=UPI001B87ABCC|nr:uncharacterized protein EDB91DRAFT_1078297 [Suillus paluster]KAG1751532.1 hypothetical protein EDB91DRAFT_1078297 [Suillus paluster]
MTQLIVMLPFPIGTTYGAYFLSTIFCAMLWGASCIQTLSYFTRLVNSGRCEYLLDPIFSYVRDDRWLKIMTVLIFHGAYAYLVLHFGDFSFFEVVLPVSSTVVCVCVQGIFVVKAYRLSETRSKVLPSLWVRINYIPKFTCSRWFSKQLSLGLFELGAAFYCVVKSFHTGNLGVFTASLKLHRQAMTLATSEMIQRMIIFSVLSGIWTALFALLDMITYLGFPNTAVYVVFDLPLCSLYCNTLLASLNSRDSCIATGRYINGGGTGK